MKAGRRDALHRALRAWLGADRAIDLLDDQGRRAGRWILGDADGTYCSPDPDYFADLQIEPSTEGVRKVWDKLLPQAVAGERLSLANLGWLVATRMDPSRRSDWPSHVQEVKWLRVAESSLSEGLREHCAGRGLSPSNGGFGIRARLVKALALPPADVCDVLRVLCRITIKRGQRAIYWLLREAHPQPLPAETLLDRLEVDRDNLNGKRTSLRNRIVGTQLAGRWDPPLDLMITRTAEGWRLQDRVLEALPHVPVLVEHLDQGYDGVFNDLRPLTVPPPPWLDLAPAPGGKGSPTPPVGGDPDEPEPALLRHLREAPNVVLQGPPGTGKTWAAEQLVKYLAKSDPAAWTLTALRADRDLEELLDSDALKQAPVVWEVVQLHPGYAYEDFVRGQVADSSDGGLSFVSRDRVLVEMARVADARNGAPVVLVLDEINRCNLASVLGELILILEESKRGTSVRLQYAAPPGRGRGADSLALPPNLWIVGTMNTADRSIALVDYAIRRRFRFLDCDPDPGALDGIYGAYPARQTAARRLFEVVSAVTRSARLAVGHTYFIVEDAPSDAVFFERLARRFLYEVVPLLREYHAERRLRADVSELPPWGIPLGDQAPYRAASFEAAVVGWLRGD